MPKRILVSDGSNTKEIAAERLVIGGLVKNVQRVVVVIDGVAREVFISS